MTATLAPPARELAGTRYDCALERHGGATRFVKRASDPGRRRGLARERRAHEALTRCDGVRGLLARLIGADGATLVFEGVPGIDLRAAHERGYPRPALLASAVGEALATLHALGPVERVPPALGVPDRQVHRPDAELIALLSGGQIELVRLIQRSERLYRALDDVPRCGRTHFIHGDMRWENVLVVDRTDAGPVRLVDWETAGLGDPHWDLGCFVAEALSAWTGDLPGGVAADGRQITESTDGANRPNAWIGAFLDAYVRQRPDAAASADTFVSRVFQLAAVRLLYRTLEAVATCERATVGCAVDLQLAANVLADPLAAGRAFGTGLGRRMPEERA